MKILRTSEVDLEFQHMIHIMERHGMDYKNTDAIFDFQEKVQYNVWEHLSRIQDVVRDFKVSSEYVSHDNRDKEWYKLWGPYQTPHILYTWDVNTNETDSFSVPLTWEGNLEFKDLFEAVVFGEICHYVSEIVQEDVTVKFSIDILEKIISIPGYIQSIRDDINNTIFNMIANGEL